METPEVTINETKAARVTTKNMSDTLSASPHKSRSRSLAITKLDEAYLWLGRDLEELIAAHAPTHLPQE